MSHKALGKGKLYVGGKLFAEIKNVTFDVSAPVDIIPVIDIFGRKDLIKTYTCLDCKESWNVSSTDRCLDCGSKNIEES